MDSTVELKLFDKEWRQLEVDGGNISGRNNETLVESRSNEIGKTERIDIVFTVLFLF